MKPNKIKAGFSLIELMVAIAIVGLVAFIVGPNLRSRNPRYEREAAISRINGFLSLVWNNAMMTGNIHKVILDTEKKQLRAELQITDDKGQQKFVPYVSKFIATTVPWPDTFELRNVFLERRDELATVGSKNFKVSFYIMPDGLAQELTINLFDKKDTQAGVDGSRSKSGNYHTVGLVLNPFTAQFTVYNEFQQNN